MLDGDRAVGVRYAMNNAMHEAVADQVILSAGAINTPRLLMLSGIGPEKELRHHGIRIRVRADDVGQHLQDHPQAPVIARTKREYGYARYAYGVGMIAAGLQYLTTKTGPAATNGIESVAYFNPDDPEGEPTIQSFHSAVIANEALGAPDRRPGVTLENVVLQPVSRGTVTLRDDDPRSDPLIDPNWLAEPEDMRLMVAGLRRVREVLDAPALRDIIEVEVQPGEEAWSDEDLAEHARRRLTCMWHPIGTCRMGRDGGSVVDPRLHVRGLRNLRVIDASIMPNIVSGNTNAPTMALASRGLELFRQEAGF
jgi:choline dehydrogenase-like flavoprotein